MTTLYAPLTIEDVKTLLPGVSERALREAIREHQCYSMIGGKMYLEVEDFQELLRKTKACRSKSNGAKGSLTSTGPLTANALDKALELATRKSQPVRKQKRKRVSTEPPSTGSNAKPPSLKLVSNT